MKSRVKMKLFLLNLSIFIGLPIVMLIKPVEVEIIVPNQADDDLNKDAIVTEKPDFAQRRQRLDEICQKYAHPFRPESQYLHSKELAKIRNFGYFYFKEGFTMICSIHKVGSNSMHNFLMDILERESKRKKRKKEKGYIDPEAGKNENELWLPVTENCWLDCAKNHTKVIMVRHPLERLLSAYFYIFGNQGKYHYEKYTWEEFVNKLITNDQDSVWTDIQKSVGDHWQPYWHNCQVCDPSLKPDYIIKLETLRDDLETFLKDQLLSHYSHRFPKSNSQKDIPTSLRVREYYSRLNESTVRQLYEFYRLDHELFDYSPDMYFDLAMK